MTWKLMFTQIPHMNVYSNFVHYWGICYSLSRVECWAFYLLRMELVSQLFLWCLTGHKCLLSKSFLSWYAFIVLLLSRISFRWGFFVSMLVGIYEFPAFIAPSVGNMSKKKTRGTHYHDIPWVLSFLVNYSQLLESCYDYCIYNIQGFYWYLVEEIGKKYIYFIFSEAVVLQALLKSLLMLGFCCLTSHILKWWRNRPYHVMRECSVTL